MQRSINVQWYAERDPAESKRDCDGFIVVAKYRKCDARFLPYELVIAQRCSLKIDVISNNGQVRREAVGIRRELFYSEGLTGKLSTHWAKSTSVLQEDYLTMKLLIYA